jgi:hypothetical protein
VHGLWDLVRRVTAAGELDLPREDILFFATPHPQEVSVNSTRVIPPLPLLGTDVWDLSYAELVSRRQVRQIVAFLHRCVPGFETAYLGQSGTHIGVRKTRRIQGDYRLTGEDVRTARKFDDVAARSTYPIDVHNPQGTGTVLERLPPGEAYDIPLRCLLPQALENVMTAGRCISGSHEAHSSYRVMPVRDGPWPSRWCLFCARRPQGGATAHPRTAGHTAEAPAPGADLRDVGRGLG